MILKVWDLINKKQYRFSGHTEFIRSIATTSDNNRSIVSSGDEATMRIWSIREMCGAGVLQGHAESIRSIAITSDNKYIVSGGGDNAVRIYNLQDKAQEAVFQGHTGFVRSLAITSDNKYIVSGGADQYCENMEPTRQNTRRCAERPYFNGLECSNHQR